MEKNRYDFIIDLINKNKLSQSQKNRILKLSALELQKGNKEFDVRLSKIEELIKGDNNTKPYEVKKKIYGNPKHVADFMSLFNKRDGFKYLTHDYDETDDFNISKTLTESEKIFKEITHKNLNIPQNLYSIVWQYAFTKINPNWRSISEDYEKEINITIGLSSKEIQDWSNINHLHPIRNEDYRKIILDFKRIIRIEKNNLEKLINTVIKTTFNSQLDDFIIDKKDLSKADFYSHIGDLKSAFSTIFEEIINRADVSDKKRISIEYERDAIEDYIIRRINITHFNSYPTKELELLINEWQEKGSMGNIKEKLSGYCHWSVETMIDGKATKVNILKEKNTPEYEIIDTKKTLGFKHILTFYYK